MATNNNSLPILEFKGENYEYCSIHMKNFLIKKGSWEIMEDDYADLVDWSVFLATNRETIREA